MSYLFLQSFRSGGFLIQKQLLKLRVKIGKLPQELVIFLRNDLIILGRDRFLTNILSVHSIKVIGLLVYNIDQTPHSLVLTNRNL
jgi:hypothetical protein